MNKFKILVLLAAALFLFNGGGVDPFPVPSADGEIFLHRPLEAVVRGHFPLNQGQYGTCVAFGHAGACDILEAIDVVTGKKRSFQAASPDAIYAGSRNEGLQRISHSYSQGSNGYSAVAWLNKYGGVLHKKNYPGFHDLTSYSIPRCRDWGAFGNGGKADGINGPFDKEAAKIPVKGVAKIKTIADLDAALDRACPVTICSNIGFDSPRDKDGFCRPAGSWSHCMLITGRRNGGRKGYLIQNSWGAYIRGDGPNSSNKYQDQPDGSFYAEPGVVARILAQGDSWALSNSADFKTADLPEWLTDANARAPEPTIEPPKFEPTPDPISTPKESTKLLEKVDAAAEAMKPLTAEEFAKLSGLSEPAPVPPAPVARPAAPGVSACANGQCGPMRRRWFR